MERQTSLLAARGLTDEQDHLLTADDALAELQERCGGTLPGALAVPELLELVRQGREMGLRLARGISAFDGEDFVSGYAHIHPLEASDGGGCEVLIEDWHRRPMADANASEKPSRLDEIDRASAEVSARLDHQQRVQFLNASGADTESLEAIVHASPKTLWTDHVQLKGIAHQQPLHWRLLDGAFCTFEGSGREWRVRLLPIGSSKVAPRGFELLLIANEPLDLHGSNTPDAPTVQSHTRLIGTSLTPVLRQPIARVIANAETISARLAGPLKQEYSDYAGNIAAAGQHLIGLLEDLADLEVVEAPGFVTAREPVDMADAARRAGGILGVRAQARNMTLQLPDETFQCIASGEFRRVLQIMINLIGNAIAYSPDGSTVTVTVEADAVERTVTTIVRDEGPGVDEDQAHRIFEKFERLGRTGDGGSGLGLYISHRLARAMGGELDIANVGEGGAQFRLVLPADE